MNLPGIIDKFTCGATIFPSGRMDMPDHPPIKGSIVYVDTLPEFVINIRTHLIWHVSGGVHRIKLALALYEFFKDQPALVLRTKDGNLWLPFDDAETMIMCKLKYL